MFFKIPDFDYWIDVQGNVKNKKGCIKKSYITKCGYVCVTLYKKPKYYEKLVHRLVALTFLDNPENKKTVNHIDGDKLNNQLSNLEWCTQKENIQHAHKIGLVPDRHGENCSTHKLTENQVREIRDLVNEMEQKTIALLYNTTQANISAIINRKRWKRI